MKDSNLEFREGMHELLKLQQQHSIPFVIVSAGVGDPIQAALDNVFESLDLSEASQDNIKIISNLGEYKYGILVDFKGETVHTANKENHISTHHLDEMQELSNEGIDKQDIILMGDVIDDLRMIENVDYYNLIKIGFFNHSVNEHNQQELQDFKKKFDIVVTNDGSLLPACTILEAVLNKDLISNIPHKSDFTEEKEKNFTT